MKPPLLLQPTSPNYDTGGYLYNRRLAERGAVRLVTLKAEELASFEPAEHDTVIVDSLAMRRPPPNAPWLERRAWIALVHHLACLEDGAAPAMNAPELAWLTRASSCIATSEFMRVTLLDSFPEKLSVACYPGVDDAFRRVGSRGRAPAPTPGPSTILTVGHVIERKGYMEACTALAALRSRRPDLEFDWHVVGSEEFEPAYAGRFRERVQRLGLAQQLRFHGPLVPADVVHRFAQADLFFLPARFEACGMVYLEALAARVPIVAGNRGEVAGLLQAEAGAASPHSAFGTACPTGDANALGLALEWWLERLRSGTRQPPAPAVVRDWDVVGREFAAATLQLAGA